MGRLRVEEEARGGRKGRSEEEEEEVRAKADRNARREEEWLGWLG